MVGADKVAVENTTASADVLTVKKELLNASLEKEELSNADKEAIETTTASKGVLTVEKETFNITLVKKELSNSTLVTSDANVQQQTIDENIYTFNKLLIDSVYNVLCFLYPVRGTERDYARFFVLETVARVPYFAYLSVLHLRETFGERDLEYKMRTHYAEADNEFHHLLIMEYLGGNKNPLDRFLAQSMAFVYYWYVVLVYLLSEEAAYHLSELIEDHAYNTYDSFLKTQEDRLKTLPVPDVARKYYSEDNPIWLDQFHVKDDGKERGFSSRGNAKLESLYDVFVNVRDDEKEHWAALCNLVQYGEINGSSFSSVKSTPQPASSSFDS